MSKNKIEHEMSDYTTFCLMMAAELDEIDKFTVVSMFKQDGLDYGELLAGYVRAGVEIFENCNPPKPDESLEERHRRLQRKHSATTEVVDELLNWVEDSDVQNLNYIGLLERLNALKKVTR